MADWYKDYTKTPVNITKLTMEIEDDGLTPNLLYIENDNSGSDNLRVTFDAEVTGGELTTLDATVAAHDGAAATYYTIYCYDCGCAQGARALATLTACPVCSGTDIQTAYHKDDLDATADPTINDDETKGFCEGSVMINKTSTPKKAFICLDNATGAAVWTETTVQTDPNAIQKDGSVTFTANQPMGGFVLTDSGGLYAEAGQDMVIKLGDNAGVKKLSFTDSDDAEIASLDSDGNLNLYNALNIYDPTGAELALLSRDLNYFYIKGGTGATEIRFGASTALVLRLTATELTPMVDSVYNVGHPSFSWNDAYIDHIYLRDDGRIDVKAGVDFTLKLGDNAGANKLSIIDSADAEIFSIDSNGSVTIADAQNIILNTTTGTKLGTNASQKLGFWNATPVVQPSHIVDADGTLADITTKFNTLLAQMATVGLQAAT